MERTCKKCGETKPIEKFKKCKSCKNGIGHICKTCARRRDKSTIRGMESSIRHKKASRLRHPWKPIHPPWKDSSESYKLKRRLQEKKRMSRLADSYVIGCIRKCYGLNTKAIRQNEEFVMLYSTNLKLKRLIKNNEDEKCNRPEN